jgi:thymidine kinase
MTTMTASISSDQQVPVNERLFIIVGSMFSGKSTELLRRVRRARHGKKRTLLVKPKIDTRYSVTHVVTHDSAKELATVLEHITELFAIEELDEVDMLGIDEAQFFPGLYETVMTLLKRYPNLTIHVAGLNADSNNNAFGEIWQLGPKASGLMFLTGVCAGCGYDAASRSACMVKKSGAILIGGETEYLCTCQKCHQALNVTSSGAASP